jgi:hypothetical protein
MSLNNTMQKWKKVEQALTRVGTMRNLGSLNVVLQHNAPIYHEIQNLHNNAFRHYSPWNFNILENYNRNEIIRRYFMKYPENRKYINRAHNKLNNLNRQLNKVASKIVAARTLQRRWRAARSPIMAKRKVASLISLKHLPRNVKRSVILTAFPKPVYGPNTELNALRKIMERKYRTY